MVADAAPFDEGGGIPLLLLLRLPSFPPAPSLTAALLGVVEAVVVEATARIAAVILLSSFHPFQTAVAALLSVILSS